MHISKKNKKLERLLTQKGENAALPQLKDPIEAPLQQKGM